MKTLLTSFSLAFLLSTAPARAGPDPADDASGRRHLRRDRQPTAPATTAKATVSADYRLVPGDKLRIEVYKDAQLSQSVQVRPDGKITLPLANDVTAAGHTPTELRDAIVDVAQDLHLQPDRDRHGRRDGAAGDLRDGRSEPAGPQPLTGKMDVLQALATAKGLHATSPTPRTS